MVNGATQDSQSGICSLTKLQEKGLQLSLPNFQRGYVWGETQWGQLWDDVSNLCARLMKNDADSAVDSLPQHFMGVIMLMRTDNGNYDVLDGQQRLTTIAMLLDCHEAIGAGASNASALQFALRRAVMLHDAVINHLTEALMEILPEKTDQ